MTEVHYEQGVIDRFEGEYAVILVGEAQRPLDVARAALPPTAREGDWLRIQFVDHQVTAIELDPESTAAARRRVQAKLERLRRGEHLQRGE
ncbi:DUF3006 domain-containing protein [Chloroflexus sp. MS-CIW-1]|jgi:hypothetical protein|uniref:DUF3006 domain-containing protein n=1 Tax=unclassified Chloroflexus TaxID=2633855 RepID=UPI0004DF2B62|nr:MULTISPECIES: DUF3006 domain-containing protein [unclassified Chloroflexus]MDN5271834.1 DUF3006 domain-containing protein [Chloroflexus sp. MS-CIW-1]